MKRTHSLLHVHSSHGLAPPGVGPIPRPGRDPG